MSYIGNHGAELLRAGSTTPEVAADAAAYRDQIQRFAAAALTGETVPRVRLRGEDKSAIYAFHWRGAPDAVAAESAARELAEQAEAQGLWVHWGRMVLEIRPPIELTKGTGIRSLLSEHPEIRSALYVGDDRTDVDAFLALQELQSDGKLDHVVCLGVRSAETPDELIEAADALVDGPDGVRDVLEKLAEAA
jgi:trehalose 6-phosphate phosphatase